MNSFPENMSITEFLSNSSESIVEPDENSSHNPDEHVQSLPISGKRPSKSQLPVNASGSKR